LSCFQDPEEEKREKIRGLWLDLVEKEEGVKEIFKTLEEAVEKFKTEKKEDAFITKKKNIDAEFASAGASIAEIQKSLKMLSPPLSSMVNWAFFLLFFSLAVLTSF